MRHRIKRAWSRRTGTIETRHGAERFLAALVGIILGGLAFGAAGLFLTGIIGDAVNPNFGQDFEGMEWLPVGTLVGAVLGAFLGLWLALRMTGVRK